ncbi:MAG TPA: TIM-barrel domain-containing protein [Verrucomicrobiae bacterium]|jgi:hypothetical protein|nr:TIM-barrel domain-containing protein [Verrucomicrobiae bacterium]
MSKWLVRLVLFLSLCVTADADERNVPWGINAIALTNPCAAEPTWESLPGKKDEIVVLDRFYRLGGENLPVTPTECQVAYNSNALFVVFRCSEPDMRYPAKQHKTDWFKLLRSPSEQDAAYPDHVDVLLLPDTRERSYYHFAATLDGESFGAKRQANSGLATSDDEPERPHIDRVTNFEARVIRREKDWVAFFRIPWSALGGRPASYFGFIPLRTRWRDSEVTTPVAADFTDRPPLDSYIEVHFAGASAPVRGNYLCELPSGAWRWQRAAALNYPDSESIHKIWRMEQSLGAPTDASNFADRLYLTQRWTDLLELEGFNFRPMAGSIAREDLTPSLVRRNINRALGANHSAESWRLLDRYLGKLDSVSRRWFADGSPANIRAEEWTAVTKVKTVEARDNVAILHCAAGSRPVDVHLSFPATGGVRLWANAEGFFKPAALLPLKLYNSHDNVRIAASNESVLVARKSFGITFCDSLGRKVARLGPGSLAFRFDSDGKVLAVDFRNHLDPDEVIYGFGEKYDRFNENGNVLTLWGVDDWIGNTEGLRNQSYKPVPVFHSGKGYSVFVNSTYQVRADVGKSRSNEIRLSQHGPVFDYYFWIEPPAQAIESYTALTGKPLLPPKWAFEPWIGRTGRGWSDGPLRNPVAEEEQVVKRFAEMDIPHSAIYAEGSSADSAALNSFAAERGLRVLSWFYSSIGRDAQAKLLPEIPASQLPVLNAGEDEPNDPIKYIDFTNPHALELCRRWWKRRLDLGVAGSMVDFGDRTPESAVFYDGRKGDEMHNFYSYDYQRTYHQVFAERRGDDFILFGRAAAPGTQQWAAQFAGDHRANFVGLRAVLTGALNLCGCGFSTWGSDLGGFLGWPDPAVYMRWTQFACFSPLMRNHGRTPREPWEYGDAAVANYKFYAWVRENLLDYIYDAAKSAHQTGLPIMRSMPVAYPENPSLAFIGDEYLFGPDLLVAPIITENNSRPIVFPPGKWTSLWDGSVVTGKIEVTASLDRIPVYLREGAVVPVDLGTNLQFGQSMTPGRVHGLVISAPAKPFHLENAKASELLVYGAEMVTAKIDGSVLPRRETISRGGRVIVHLPPVLPGRKTREIEIELGTKQANGVE